jgi:nucleoside-diphosphate-sugar epimerase
MKHFITGGSGFFGLHLIDRLLKEHQEVVVYDVTPLDDDYLQKPGVSFVQGDVRDREKLLEAMKGCSVVHHNAAVLPVSRSGKVFYDINVGGTKNVLEAALANGVRKVLFVSTSSVYGIPTDLPVTEATKLTPLGEYGWSKYNAEQVVEEFRKNNPLDISIVRPRTIIGTGRMGIFGILFDWIERGKTIYIIGKGDNLYQFLSAPDLADACWLIASKPCENEDFILGASDYGTVKGDLEALISHAKTTSKVRPTNAFIVRNILAIVDWMKISPLVDWHYKTPHKPFYFDTTKAQTMLGWEPQYSNVRMFTDTYDWYMKNREQLNKTTGTTHRKAAKQGILKVLRWFS